MVAIIGVVTALDWINKVPNTSHGPSGKGCRPGSQGIKAFVLNGIRHFDRVIDCGRWWVLGGIRLIIMALIIWGQPSNSTFILAGSQVNWGTKIP